MENAFANQREQLLDLMLNGKEISSRTAMIEYGIGRLGSRIAELRKIYPVLDRWERYINDNGKRVRYKVYYMEAQ